MPGEPEAGAVRRGHASLFDGFDGLTVLRGYNTWSDFGGAR